MADAVLNDVVARSAARTPGLLVADHRLICRACPSGQPSGQDDKDAALLGELASMVELSLEQLASGRSLGACRKRLQTARGSLRTAVSVTAGLKTRLEAASADILSLHPRNWCSATT